MSIKKCISTTESLAHKFGLEQTVEDARQEHDALLRVARLASSLTCSMVNDEFGAYLIDEDIINDFLNALGELK